MNDISKDPGVLIEPATAEDAREILDLQKLAYRSEAEIYDDYSIPPLTQSLEDIQAAFYEKTFLKATVAGRIVGAVRGYVLDETCMIGRLIVHPDFQSQGIGSGLMGAIEKCFSDVKRFELFTGHKSERNVRLYRRLGYRVTRRERVNETLELVYMEKRSRRTQQTAREERRGLTP